MLTRISIAVMILLPLTNTYKVQEATLNLPRECVSASSMDVQTADLDGDGDLDLVIAVEFKQNQILLNDGHGKFVCASDRLPQKAHDSEDVALADFDNDGDIDIVFVSEDDEQHEYYLNDGHAHFTDVSDRIPVQTVCNAVVAGDFDGDGDLDLILGNAGAEKFLANDGKGNFSDQTTSHLPPDITTTQDVEKADIDGDGDLDIILGNEDGNRIYINDGKGKFTDETSKRLPAGNEETRKVDIADIDGDGDLDVFFSNVNFTGQTNIQNRILINNAKGFFTDETAKRFLADNTMHTGDASFADLDKDGDLDLVLANLADGYVQVCYNDGAGVFTEVTEQVFGVKTKAEAISVLVADLNNDSVPDIYLGLYRAVDRLFFGGQ